MSILSLCGRYYHMEGLVHKMTYRIKSIIGGLLLLALLLGVMPVAAQQAQVRVLFFTSPTCSFCAQVEEQVLPPLENEYGERLNILRIDTTTQAGQRLFQETMERYNVPAELRGVVPMMFLDEHVLVGAREIPEQLPGLVSSYLEAGGLDWPAIPGLDDYIAAEAERAAAGDQSLWLARFRRDLPGNYVSLALLMGMLALAVALIRPRPWQRTLSERVPFWLKVATALVGLSVALYLTYGETTPEELVCGPIGQCNVVQQSDLAILFGFLPMALFGALGYLAILATYAYERWGKKPHVELAPVISLGLTTFGFGFSIFLTFWQPFGIGATCMWCLASAVTMSLSYLFNTGSGRTMLEKINRQGWPAYLRHLKRRARRKKRRQRSWSSRSTTQRGSESG
jgi:uncharacterized membrane protein